MKTLPRYLRKFLILLTVTLILIVVSMPVSLPALLQTEWAKTKISSLLSESLERHVHIKGAIDLKLSLIPELTITELVIENPETFSRRDMLTAGTLSLSAPLLPNLTGAFEIEKLHAQDLILHVAEDSETQLNWNFSDEEPEKENKDSSKVVIPGIKQISLNNILLLTEVDNTSHKISFQNIQAENINLEGSGSLSSSLTVDGRPVTLKSGLSSINSFFEGSPLEFEIDLEQEANHLVADGKFHNNGEAHLRIKASGEDLSSLSSLSGTTLPAFKNYSLSSDLTLTPTSESKSESISITNLELKLADRIVTGQLTLEYAPDDTISINTTLNSGSHNISAKGNYRTNGAIDFIVSASGDKLSELSSISLTELPPWKNYSIETTVTSPSVSQNKFELTNLKLNLDKNDLQGDVSFSLSPLYVSAKLQSQNFDLGVLSADSGSGSGSKQKTQEKETPRIPYEIFQTFNADIELKAAKLRTFLNMELEDTDFIAKVKDGRLEVSNLSGKIFGGSFTAKVTAADKAMRWKLDGKNFAASPIALLAGSTPVFEGDFNLNVDLTGKGEELPDILKTLSGSIRLNSEDAKIKSSTLHAAASGLSDILGPLLESADEASSECLLFNYKVNSGIATSKEQVIKLGEVFIIAEGKINFPENKIAYNFNVHSSNPALASLIPPFRAFGKLSNPYFTPSISGSVASVTDSGEKAIGSVFDIVQAGADLAAETETDKIKLSGLAVCKEAYKEEQNMFSSQIGKLFDGESAAKKMHPSWDTDSDNINDCEKDGSCDHTFDYSKPRKKLP